LWVAVEKYVLTPAELAVLGEACRTADELARLEEAVRMLPELTTLGSTGQIRPHPLLNEVRLHRQLFDRLAASLNLPNEDEEVGLSPSQRHAQKAAPGRWSPTNGGRTLDERLFSTSKQQAV
jgi:hypothetical protein